MALTFDPDARFDSNRDVVLFTAREGERRIPCGITLEALVDRAQSYARTSAELLELYRRFEPDIRTAVERKLRHGQIDPDGSVTIMSGERF